jgi:hypothetical protein
MAWAGMAWVGMTWAGMTWGRGDLGRRVTPSGGPPAHVAARECTRWREGRVGVPVSGNLDQVQAHAVSDGRPPYR